MKTEQDLNGDILQLTMAIEAMFPELSKYIGEMPVKISNTPSLEIDRKNLASYYDSLASLLENYAPYHTAQQFQKQKSCNTPR